ncbi:MAG: hypothetical protein R3338_11800, partial [Thermoanaerobaculia bacterium]|nr:hypothetical protein [Thermoanaerobaculia bacterium]
MFDRQEESTEQTEAAETKSRKKLFITIGIVLILVVGVSIVISVNGNADPADAAETSESEEDEKAPVPVEVTEAKVDEVSSYITATANLTAENEVEVLSESEGRVSRFHYEEGDRVSRGAVLATLVSDEQQILLDKARARAENARAAYERASELWESELISWTEF